MLQKPLLQHWYSITAWTWYISHGFRRRENKGEVGARGCTEQLFSLVLIKMWAALKRSEIDQKKEKKEGTSLLIVCIRRSRSCRLIPSSLSKGESREMGERISRVTDKQHISMLCSLPLFLQLGDKIQAWQWLPAQLILAEEYDCRVWGLSIWIAAVKMLKGNLFLVYMQAISWSYWD